MMKIFSLSCPIQNTPKETMRLFDITDKPCSPLYWPLNVLAKRPKYWLSNIYLTKCFGHDTVNNMTFQNFEFHEWWNSESNYHNITFLPSIQILIVEDISYISYFSKYKFLNLEHTHWFMLAVADGNGCVGFKWPCKKKSWWELVIRLTTQTQILFDDSSTSACVLDLWPLMLHSLSYML